MAAGGEDVAPLAFPDEGGHPPADEDVLKIEDRPVVVGYLHERHGPAGALRPGDAQLKELRMRVAEQLIPELEEDGQFLADEEIELEFEYVNEIKIEPNGKLKFIVQNIKSGNQKLPRTVSSDHLRKKCIIF